MMELVETRAFDICHNCHKHSIYLIGFALYFPGSGLLNPEGACYLCADCLSKGLAMIPQQGIRNDSPDPFLSAKSNV
jgi:hypothetical protein